MLDLVKDLVHLKRLVIQCYTWLVIVLVRLKLLKIMGRSVLGINHL